MMPEIEKIFSFIGFSITKDEFHKIETEIISTTAIVTRLDKVKSNLEQV